MDITISQTVRVARGEGKGKGEVSVTVTVRVTAIAMGMGMVILGCTRIDRWMGGCMGAWLYGMGIWVHGA